MKFEDLNVDGWHRVVRVNDDDSGLDAIISVHDISLGPSCGGCRVYPYKSFEEGLNDAKNLSRGMTYKNAIGGIPFGGGKAVIFADPAKDKTPAMMQAMGRAIDALDGLYYTAEDSGMSENDILEIRTQTSYAAGMVAAGKGGNPSPFTAKGVWRGMQAASRHKFGIDDFDGVRVAILGVGAVGMVLGEYLHNAGAKLVVADVNKRAAEEACHRFGATPVSPEEAAGADVDIFAPCALGGAINEDTIDTIQAKIVAGAANNQLKTPEMDQALRDRGILYAPDYVINAAGVISIGLEILGTWSEEALNNKIDAIGENLEKIFKQSEVQNLPTGIIADQLAANIIAEGVNQTHGSKLNA